ncbi:MAG TPA: hypothetical protein VFZ19_02345 [Solirubrobacterales bacterium]
MPTISQHYKLKQPFEFLDVDIEDDNRLFLDPHAIRLEKGPSPYGRKARESMDSFFNEVVGCVRSPSNSAAMRGLDLLQHFNEPKETRLGMSRSGIDGHGAAEELGGRIWNALSTDARALVEVGVLKLVEHIPLFVDEIDKDITSDITTRIVFEPLARFTQAMVKKYPEFTQGAHKMGVFRKQVWHVGRADWVMKDLQLPVPAGKPLLLVPKHWARPSLLMPAGRYYETLVLTFVQEELGTIDSATGKLTGHPNKETLKRRPNYKRGRPTIVRTTEEAKSVGEDLVDRFRVFVDRKYGRLTDEELEERLRR